MPDAMPTLPPNVVEYQRTRTFDEASVPAGLLANHTTKPGVWGRIEVESGEVDYLLLGHTHTVTPTHAGIIPPTVPHALQLRGPVRFQVVFLR